MAQSVENSPAIQETACMQVTWIQSLVGRIPWMERLTVAKFSRARTTRALCKCIFRRGPGRKAARPGRRRPRQSCRRREENQAASLDPED